MKNVAESGFNKRFLKSMIIVLGLVIGLSGFSAAQSTGIADAKVVDRVDNDGDGYISSFEVQINANAYVNEKGNYYNPLEARGEPAFSVFIIPEGGTQQLNMEAEMYKTIGQTDYAQFTMEYNGEELKNFAQNELNTLYRDTDYTKSQYMDVIEGRRNVKSLYVVFEESDGVGANRHKNEHVSSWEIKLDKPMQLELPSKDRTKSIPISSSPSGATVNVDGKEVGTTTTNVEVAVDRLEREGFMDVSVYKDGYNYERERIRSSLPDSLEFELEKEKDFLLVDSNKDDATVRVNGEEVGKTPYMNSYWVKGSHEVTVEKDGEVKEFENVKVPTRIDAEFSTDTQSSGDDSNTSFNYNYDLMNSIDYSFISNFPELESMFNVEFNVSDSEVKSGENVVLDASPTYNIGFNISEYRWKIDGNQVATQTSPVYTHSFSNPGNHTVNLTAVNTNGTSKSAVRYIQVNNLLPKPSFIVANGKLDEGEVAEFDASNSVDTDGSITQYNWDMGDGSTYQRQGPELNHVYDSSGEYTVELEVTDSTGDTQTITKKVTVETPNLKPVPSFTVPNTNLEVNETVKFDASGSSDSDGSISTYAWNMGDGMSKTGEKVSYNYSQAGNYTVELIVLDTGNLKATTSKQITVENVQDQSTSQNNSENSSQPVQDSNETDAPQTQENESESVMNQIMKIIYSFF